MKFYVYNRVQNIPLIFNILKHFHSVNNIKSFVQTSILILSSHFCPGLPQVVFTLRRFYIILHIYSCQCVLHALPSQPPSFDHHNNIFYDSSLPSASILILLIILLPSSVLGMNISPRQPSSDTLNSCPILKI